MLLRLLLPGRRHEQPPPGLTRGRLGSNVARRVGTTLIALAVVVLGAFAIDRMLGPDPAIVWLVALAPVALVLSAMTGGDRQGRAEVAAANWGLCLCCRYPLVHETSTGLMRCPECGNAWEATLLERSWRWTYRHLPSPEDRQIEPPEAPL